MRTVDPSTATATRKRLKPKLPSSALHQVRTLLTRFDLPKPMERTQTCVKAVDRTCPELSAPIVRAVKLAVGVLHQGSTGRTSGRVAPVELVQHGFSAASRNHEDGAISGGPSS